MKNWFYLPLVVILCLSLLAACAPAPLSAADIPGSIGPSGSLAVQAQRVTWLPDGSSILAGQGSRLLWVDPVSLQEEKSLELNQPIEGLMVNPGGDQILVLIDPAQAIRVDLVAGQPRGPAEAWREIQDFCPPGQSLDVLNFQNAYCGDADLLLAVKAANKKWQSAIRSGGTMQKLSPDGKTWALGLGGVSEATTWLIDVNSKELRHKLVLQGGNLISVNGALAVDFSPDSNRLAMADLAGLITIWDVKTGEKQSTLAAGELATDIAFSPDGKQIVMCGERNLLLFDVR